jgi:hypothetical protein
MLRLRILKIGFPNNETEMVRTIPKKRNRIKGMIITITLRTSLKPISINKSGI